MVLDLLSYMLYSKFCFLSFFFWISLKFEFLNIDILGMIFQLILVLEGGKCTVVVMSGKTLLSAQE